MTYFENPHKPDFVMLETHHHDWYEVGATRYPNGTWNSVWACRLCPDLGVGGKVGPIPPGYCPCGWVQKKWPRKKCESCKHPLEAA